MKTILNLLVSMVIGGIAYFAFNSIELSCMISLTLFGIHQGMLEIVELLEDIKNEIRDGKSE